LFIASSQIESKQQTAAWIYSKAQNRARRTSNADYDDVIPNNDGIRVMDEIDMMGGGLDRYEWSIEGKKELLVSYNNHVMSDAIGVNLEPLLNTEHINQDVVRYEKHRVWVVLAKLKEGHRHVYPVRRFYVDEDSWLITYADIYNKNLELWRSATRYPIHYKNIDSMGSLFVTYNDLNKGKYFYQAIPPFTYNVFDVPLPEKMLTSKYLPSFVNDELSIDLINGVTPR